MNATHGLLDSGGKSPRGIRRVEMSERDAAEQLRAKVAQYYGPAVTRPLFPSAAVAEGEVGDSEFMSETVAPWISGQRASSPPGEAECLVMAALLVLLHEGGGGHKVTFMLPELLGLLGWAVAVPSCEAVERALDFYMQPVRHKFHVAPTPADPGREVSITWLRTLIAGHEYSEESELGAPESVRLAGRQVTVKFNPDVPLGAGA
jgi:hypothetical protein